MAHTQTDWFGARVLKPIQETPQSSGEFELVSIGRLFHWWSKGGCEDRCSSHEANNFVCSSRFGSTL